MDRVQNIVETGIFQGWSRNNIIGQIMFEIANEEESTLLLVWCDMPELEAKAEFLYDKYRNEYYSKLS